MRKDEKRVKILRVIRVVFVSEGWYYLFVGKGGSKYEREEKWSGGSGGSGGRN